jgi:hypothetical protein
MFFSLHVSAIIGHLQVFKMHSSKETAVLCCFSFCGATVILWTLSLFVFWSRYLPQNTNFILILSNSDKLRFTSDCVVKEILSLGTLQNFGGLTLFMSHQGGYKMKVVGHILAKKVMSMTSDEKWLRNASKKSLWCYRIYKDQVRFQILVFSLVTNSSFH